MERWARVHFHVIRINRWSLALVLLVALALLLLPTRGLTPAASQAPGTVRQGVTLLGRDFSGVTEQEAKAMLAEMADSLHAQPVAAAESRDQNGVSYVIPELNGYSLDLETTWFRLSTAPEGSQVLPATRIQAPARKLADYPQGVIRQGNADKRAVAILINVDWGTEDLWKMLPVLKQRGVKATFFVSGRWADANKELLAAMARDGHEIATHGYDLSSGPTDLARAGRLKDDIAKSVASIERITGNKVRYYAPHKSEVTPEILQTAAELNLRTVLYSIDTVDWNDATTTAMILNKVATAKAGDLILMHPKPNTATVLQQAVMQVQNRGLQLLTLTDVISPDPGLSGAQTTDHQH